MRFINLLSFFMINVAFLNAQNVQFETADAGIALEEELANYFQKVETFQLDGENLNQRIESPDFDYSLKLNFGDDFQWEFDLYPADVFSENAIIRVLTENGEYEYPVPRNISFKGNVKGNPQKQVSLLIHGSYLFGHITQGTQRTYFSSANRYVKNAPENMYIVFDREDQKSDETGECGHDYYPEVNLGSDKLQTDNERSQTGLCYDVELGVVSDWSLYTDKGSTIQGAIDHVVAVMMDVETDYETADFDDALEFEIVEQVISTCEYCDEWTSSTNPNTLLPEFATWSGNGGFNNSVDMGQFWTNRDFDGSTVGLAYNGSGLLCNFAYHVLQDFSADADLLRVMTSHEIGHNLDADHVVGTTYIMSSTLNNTTSWFATSVTTVDATVDAATPGCIVACTATACAPVTNVSITSVNSTGFTISWSSTPESLYRLRVRDEEDFNIIHTATPSSSSSMTINPVGWESCHQYMVIVENDCGGSGYSAPVSSIVGYVPGACADFSADDLLGWLNHTVIFTDLSFGATSWSWDFGDGTTSTSQNPSHTYTVAGVYDVVLEVNSGAHSLTRTAYIHVIPNETFPYSAANGGDMSDDDFGTESLTSGRTSLFEKGIPSNYFTNGTTCWVTDLDADVTSQTNLSVLYSPRFDFSSVATASLSFDLGMERVYGNAPYAVQIHYSLNDGSSWTRLGSDMDVGWYSNGPSQPNSIHPAIFADEMGWLFTNQSTNYSYDVAFLTGNSSVIFRLVFSVRSGFSSNGYLDGAMIDNFELSGTLPIDLISFDGKRLNDVVKLNWQTASEINNDYFTLERSADGRNYETIAIVKGQGTSFENHSYEFVDEKPESGVNYYRLTQTDFDGVFEVFDKIVAISFVGDITAEVRPNPVRNDDFQLVYNSLQSGELKVEIYSITGKLLFQKAFRTKKQMNYFDISLSGLSNGIYMVKTNQNNIVENIRFVKTK